MKKTAEAVSIGELITFPELMALCDVCRGTVYYWLKIGKAPRYERIGERYFFYRTDAKEIARKRKKSAPPLHT